MVRWLVCLSLLTCIFWLIPCINLSLCVFMPRCIFHPVTVLCCYNLQVCLHTASSAGVELCHFVHSPLSRDRAYGNEQPPDISQVRVFCGVFRWWWWGGALLSCALYASLPRGVSLGVFWGICSEHHHGDKRGGRNTICISLIVVWLYSHSVTVKVYNGPRTSFLCVPCNNKMHTHSHRDTHPPGSSGCRRESVCVCVWMLFK